MMPYGRKHHRPPSTSFDPWILLHHVRSHDGVPESLHRGGCARRSLRSSAARTRIGHMYTYVYIYIYADVDVLVYVYTCICLFMYMYFYVYM